MEKQVEILVTRVVGGQLYGSCEGEHHTFFTLNTGMSGRVFANNLGDGDSIVLLWDSADERNLGPSNHVKVKGLRITAAQRETVNSSQGNALIQRLARLSIS